MAVDDHQITDLEAGVEAAGSIGNDQSFRSESMHHANGKLDFLGTPTLVSMRASLHEYDGYPADITQDQSPSMSCRMRYGKAWYVCVGNGLWMQDLIRQTAQATSQDNGHLGSQ